MDFAGSATVKIRVGRRTIEQPVLIVRRFSRYLLLGDDAILNLQFNVATYPQRAVTIGANHIDLPGAEGE